jgi:hypothetical protein
MRLGSERWREGEPREEEWRLPAPWLDELEPLAMTMDDGVSGVAMDFLWLALTLDRIGISVGQLATTNLVLRALAPTSVNIALPQGPTNHIQLDAPDQGARGGVDRVVGLYPL